MIGILIISHGPLAKGVWESSRFFYDDPQYVRTAVFDKEDDPMQFLEVLKASCKELENPEGILILTDIPGGTPANLAQTLMKEHPQIRLLSGVNVIMVLDALLSRERYNLDELAQHCLQSAKDSIQMIKLTDNDGNDDNDADL